jgi:LysM repeat protein
MPATIKYKVQTGDTYWIIASNVNACTGVSADDIAKANPAIPATSLQVGDVIAIPKAGTTAAVLHYTVQPGDSYWGIASNITGCAGVTADDIAQANPSIPAASLQVGQLITVPAHAQPQPAPVPAPYIGYWRRTWLDCTPPAGANLSVAFSGWADVAKAVAASQPVMAGLAGSKYICIGGGDKDTGKLTADILSSINSAIAAGQFAGYDGIAYDVEEGDSGLAQSFAQSFAAAKAAGFKVLVTVSHSAPYGITDAAALMASFFTNGNIDFLSPQLYTNGDETANQWATTAGVTWNQYATAKAAVVPAIVTPNLYADAKTTFASYGVTTQGYVVWNC